MATQRLSVATLAGHAAVAITAVFDQWRRAPVPDQIDRFCTSLRENGLSLPVVYFAEWVDRWLMGDEVPGPEAVHGRRFEASCLLPSAAIAWAAERGKQFQEQVWLASRLREAAAGWGPVTECYAVVVVREVISTSTLDEEVRASIGFVPHWLAPFVGAG